MKTSKELLHKFDLRITDSRLQILDCFRNKDHALSHADIENTLDGDFDRVTVYRTLKSFLNKGLIHKVLDNTSNLKYALCKDECSSAKHQHDHVHFKCEQCGNTVCLEDVKIPPINLPKGYLKFETSLLIQGSCNVCSK